MIHHRFINLFCSVICLAVCGSTYTAAVEIDRTFIERPDSVSLDRLSTARWQALFSINAAWVPRQVAYLESRHGDLALTLLLSRLLYRGDPWKRRETDQVNTTRWREEDIETKLTILRSLRTRGEPEIVDYLCFFLNNEKEPKLIISAFATLALADSGIAVTYAARLSDPRNEQFLPGSRSSTVRQQALRYLLQTRGIADNATRRAFDWALLHTSSAERLQAIRLLTTVNAPDLERAVVMKLAEEYRSGIIDNVGKQGLVLSISDLHGEADDDLVATLLRLVEQGERAIATTASSALGTTLSWSTPIAINDLIQRARTDPDAVVRQSLLALLIRLDPGAVSSATTTSSPWSALADHQRLLQNWTTPAQTNP